MFHVKHAEVPAPPAAVAAVFGDAADAACRYAEILAGGELRFTLQAEPNKAWPGEGAQAPYSMSR